MLKHRLIPALFAAALASVAAAEPAFSVGGYYPTHEGARRQLPVEKIDFAVYDTVYQAFLRFAADGTAQPEAGLDSAGLLAAARAAGDAKVLISVGGGNFALLPELCADAEKTAKLAGTIVDWAVGHGYDGVDLDWEGDMNTENGRRCGALIRELRARLDRAGETAGRKYLLTVTVMAGEWFLKRLDPADLALADRINLMAYDMNYRIAAYHAPLRAPLDRPEAPSTERALAFLTGKLGIPKEKICVGLPFYGNLYENLTYGEALDKANKTQRRTALGHVQIEKRTAGFRREFDPVSGEVKLTSPDGRIFALTDDAESIDLKTRQVKEQGYGGVFVWAIHQDRLPDGSAPLTAALRNAAGK